MRKLALHMQEQSRYIKQVLMLWSGVSCVFGLRTVSGLLTAFPANQMLCLPCLEKVSQHVDRTSSLLSDWIRLYA